MTVLRTIQKLEHDDTLKHKRKESYKNREEPVTDVMILAAIEPDPAQGLRMIRRQINEHMIK